jgi:hypothetical protein
MLAAYVSGHGFGHMVRVGQVLRAVRARRPELPITIVTSVDEEVCRRAAGEPVDVRHVRLDVGVAQRDALTLDERATADAWLALHEHKEARLVEEVRWLRESGARAVLADIPALAFEAAAEAGVPSVGHGNFSWDWIYAHLARREPRLGAAAADAARAYARADLMLELPFAGDLSAFPRREKIPLVARRTAHGRAEARRHFGLPPQGTLVLVTFGGIGIPGFDLGVLAGLAPVQFVATEGADAPGNVRRIDVAVLGRDGFDYVDLVAAADVVVTKPGYGIVSDAIAARTRMIYTERGDFPEYPVLVAGLTRNLPAAHVSNDDLRAGRLRDALDRVLALPFPDPPDMSGADVAGERILAVMDAGPGRAP